MNALILAAGFGTRIKELTHNKPKCLLELGDKPILEIWIEKLAKIKVKKIYINTHYLSEQIVKLISDSKYRDRIEILYEEKLLGTAGTLSNLLKTKTIDDDLFMIHADNFCLDDLVKFTKSHLERPKSTIMTMMTFISNNPQSCGVVQIDKNGILIDFFEKIKNPPTNLSNAAIYLLSKKFHKIFLKQFSGTKDFSLDVVPRLKNKIFTYKTNSKLIDIGTIDEYKKANKILLNINIKKQT